MCFEESSITVTEGERIEFVLHSTRKLSRGVNVPLLYGDAPNYSFTASGDSGRFNIAIMHIFVYCSSLCD